MSSKLPDGCSLTIVCLALKCDGGEFLIFLLNFKKEKGLKWMSTGGMWSEADSNFSFKLS